MKSRTTKEQPPVDALPAAALTHSVISAMPWEGFQVATADGRHATLAIVDDDGAIIESGASVLEEAWNVAVLAYRNFLIGEGCLRVYSSPTGLHQEEKDGSAQQH
jgi:hypothetical protein